MARLYRMTGQSSPDCFRLAGSAQEYLETRAPDPRSKQHRQGSRYASTPLSMRPIAVAFARRHAPRVISLQRAQFEAEKRSLERVIQEHRARVDEALRTVVVENHKAIGDLVARQRALLEVSPPTSHRPCIPAMDPKLADNPKTAR